MSRDDVDIRIRLREAAKFNRDARKSAREIDNIGDQAAQAARRLGALSAASSKTRLNIGPFSTSLRGGVIAVGALAYGTEKLTPKVLSAAEATATLVGGAGAAGGVGLLALAQATGVARLGLGQLMDALGGNETAAKNLSPELVDLFNTLDDARSKLADTAGAGLLPGLETGAANALPNLHVLNKLVGDTAETLGELGQDAGTMLGSKAWGRDVGTVGKANVEIIDNLGHATLNLADASRDVLVEAAPLAEWLSRMALRGSETVEVWAANARASGDMAHFFREARRDLKLLGSATGHGAHGLINLFGADDVDGTKTLENLDHIMARFEAWTTSPAVRHGVGEAIVAEIPDAAARVAEILAESLAHSAPNAAKIFLDAFMGADAWGKLLIGGWLVKKLGGFKLLGKTLGRQAGTSAAAAAAVAGKASPVPVFVTNPGWGGPGAPSKTRGPIRRAVDTAANAAKKVGPLALGAAPPLAAGAAVDAAILAPLYLLGRHQHGPVSPMADRRAAQGAANQLGFPTDPNQMFDAQGFPISRPGRAPTNPFHPDPFGPVFEVHVTTVVDGQKIDKARQRALARRRAREGR